MNDFNFKLIMIGDVNIGKSTILSTKINKKLSLVHCPTIGIDYVSFTEQYNLYNIKFNIWDTSGNHSFDNIINTYYSDVFGAIAVFNIGKKNTFDSLDSRIEQFRKIGKAFNLLIVGNIIGDKREVSPEDIAKKIKTYGARYIEVDCSNYDTINSMFMITSEMMIIDHKKRMQKMGNVQEMNTLLPVKKQGNYYVRLDNIKPKCFSRCVIL